MVVCDYFPLCVFWLGFVDFVVISVFESFWTPGYFGHFVRMSKLVIIFTKLLVS